jgi:hypothetical protein
LREDARIAVVQPFGASGLNADVAAMIEYGKSVAVLQRPRAPFLKRRARSNAELGCRRLFLGVCCVDSQR